MTQKQTLLRNPKSQNGLMANWQTVQTLPN